MYRVTEPTSATTEFETPASSEEGLEDVGGVSGPVVVQALLTSTPDGWPLGERDAGIEEWNDPKKLHPTGGVL